MSLLINMARLFSAYYARLLIAHFLYLVQDVVGFLERSEVAYAAYPSRRIEMHVNRLFRESLFDFVAYALRLYLIVS